MSRETDLLRLRVELLEKTVARITQIETRPRLILGGGGAGIIEFRVTAATTVANTASPYDGMRKLTVEIMGPSCDESELHGDTVDVYEHDPQCLTSDELDAALVDRKGWAYEGVFQDQSSGATAGDMTPCHWTLMGLCCP